MDSKKLNRFIGIAFLSVIVLLALIFFLQLSAFLFGPSKSSCTKQVCLKKFMEGPPAFNDESMASYIRNNFFTPATSSSYNLANYENIDNPFPKIKETVFKHFANKKNGVFLVLGAGDGEFKDISLDLERELNWSGLLVEPNPELFKKLLKKGRKATLTKACVSPYAYPMKIKFSYPSYPNTIEEKEIVRSLGKGRISQLWNQDKEESSKVEFEAQCIPLENLIYSAGLKSIDLLVLDMNGADLDILLNMIIVYANGADLSNDITGYFLERNMVVSGTFGKSASEAAFMFTKFVPKSDF